MIRSTSYQPPYSLTPAILRLVAEIGEAVGRYVGLADRALTPQLRRENRLRTIQASLAIENNTLTLEQVTAVIDGRHVLGHPREIHEVRNAFAAYEAMEGWDPVSEAYLLEAHRALMAGLVDAPGRFRSGGVGIFREGTLVHMAPRAERVPHVMGDLLQWLTRTDAHPLLASCVFHYEFDFIHPFEDGNGRMGRLWQTLVLRQWKPLFAYLSVETVIRERQEAYYQVLTEADRRSDATGPHRIHVAGTGRRPQRHNHDRPNNRPSNRPIAAHHRRTGRGRNERCRPDGGDGPAAPAHVPSELHGSCHLGRLGGTDPARFAAQPDPALSLDPARTALAG